ncbi:MAG: type IX secretion system outer membrane channel protein PorV [Lentimicrobiaceae bacterium]|nr:type IX secretion system outer membrane channel protein PorV [Lentimicrobiaceae bacterium]
MKRVKFLSLVFVMIITVMNLKAQNTVDKVLGQNLDYNVISTAVPFMMIAPDARSSAMGDIGVSTSPDVYSMHWNPAKYAFIEEDFSVGLAYSPWLRSLVNDMNIAYLAASKRVSPKATVAASLRYFSLGDINYTGQGGSDLGTYSPNEWAMDVTYSRKLGNYISGAVAGRFIYSDLTQGVLDYSKPAISVAADIAVFYTRDVYWFKDMDAVFSWGVSINNIGSKMNYNEASLKKDFIPTNLRFGPTLKLDIDDFNSLAFSVDINKLLVPTPPIYMKDSLGSIIYDGTDPMIESGKNNEVGPIQGMIQSFFDAPGGFKEELKEFTLGVGAEYWYNKTFNVRAGFFHESKMKGNRRYVTLGAGLRYNVFGLDVSYLVPVNNTATSGTNPLENTLRFSLTINIDRWGDNTRLERVN